MHGSTCLQRMRHDRRGASLIEYLLLVGAVALLSLAGFRAFGVQLDGKAVAQAACVQSLACGVTGADAATDGDGAALAVPVLGAAALDELSGSRAGRSGGERLLDFGRGVVVDGLWGTVTGIVEVITHPVQTAEGVWFAITHPVTTATALKDAVVAGWNENPERLAGQAVFEVVTVPVTALKAARASRVADAARATRATERAGDGGDAARIARASDEAARAALPGRVLRADPGTVDGRRALAYEALMNGTKPMTPARALSHMRGIDFSRPVELVELTPADELIQYNVPGQRGSYFAPRGTPAEALGIDPAGREMQVYRGPEGGGVALRSTAAPIAEFVDRSGRVVRGGGGGGIQFKVSDPTGFTRVP